MHEILQVLDREELKILTQYQKIVDHRSDVRPDVISKHPRWNVDDWPQDIVNSALKKILDHDYEIDEVIFNVFKISFKLHVDSGDSEKQRSGKAVILPLYTEGPASTVFFDNYWNGPSAKFSKVKNSPFQYQLPDKNDQFVLIPDLREFYKQAITEPDSIDRFEINETFIKELEYLIEARSNKKLAKVDTRCYDYSEIINYDEFAKFDENVRRTYLNHIDLESLHGLTVDRIIEWHPGNAIVFDRNQIHSASSTHKVKSCITIFTNRVE
jgi:hypothetical protein